MDASEEIKKDETCFRRVCGSSGGDRALSFEKAGVYRIATFSVHSADLNFVEGSAREGAPGAVWLVWNKSALHAAGALTVDSCKSGRDEHARAPAGAPGRQGAAPWS